MARLKKTVTLSELAPGVLKKADKTGRRYGAMAVDAWPTVVGDEIARHTRSFALRDDHELVVYVDGAAWANQLSLMADDIRLRLNAHLGENAVKSLRFTVSRKVADQAATESLETDTEAFYVSESQTPVALDSVELEQARHVAAADTNAPERPDRFVHDLALLAERRRHNADNRLPCANPGRLLREARGCDGTL